MISLIVYVFDLQNSTVVVSSSYWFLAKFVFINCIAYMMSFQGCWNTVFLASLTYVHCKLTLIISPRDCMHSVKMQTMPVVNSWWPCVFNRCKPLISNAWYATTDVVNVRGVSIAISCLSVCLFVCSYISKTHAQHPRKFCCMLPVIVARSFCELSDVLPVLWMTSCFTQWSGIYDLNRAYIASDLPWSSTMAKSDVYDYFYNCSFQ